MSALIPRISPFFAQNRFFVEKTRFSGSIRMKSILKKCVPFCRFFSKAVLVIDVQNEYFTGVLPIQYPDSETSLGNILRVMETAQENDMPVFCIQHLVDDVESPFFAVGSETAEIHPDIVEAGCTEVIQKRYPGSFTGTDLESKLRDLDINEVVITGYMTQMCCDSTSRQAFHMGLGVEFLSDATGTLDFENDGGKASAEELHRATLVAQGLFLARVMDTETWIKENEKEL